MNVPSTIGAPTSQPAGEKRASRLSMRAIAWLAWSLWVLFIVLQSVSLLLGYANLRESFLTDLSGTLILLAYATVGALVASRRPENPIGWIFCAIALLVAFSIFTEGYAIYTLFTVPGSLPLELVMAWFATWTRDIGFYLGFTFLLLLFPDGRLLSPRWRPVAWSAAALIALNVLWTAFRPGAPTYAPLINNPLGIDDPSGVYALLGEILTSLIVVLVVACVASVIVRFRRASGDERQQLKWFAYAASLMILLIGVSVAVAAFPTGGENSAPEVVYEVLFRLAVAALPIAVGIAILRHRLYDIDLLINRTLVYVPLTAIIAGMYSASVALFQRLFQAITGERSDAAIVISTLILAASFTPIKNALQAIVDRRFKEAPDYTKKLKALGKEVESRIYAIDTPQVTRRLLEEATLAFGAQSGALYLAQDGGLQLVHTQGEWTGSDVRVSVPLQNNDTQLGVLELGSRNRGLEYTDKDRATLQQVTDQVAAAIMPAGRVG